MHGCACTPVRCAVDGPSEIDVDRLGEKRAPGGHRQTVENDPNRTLRAPRRELWYPASNAMGRFNEAADPQLAFAARASSCPRRAPQQHKMAWHPHLLGAARQRLRGDRMSALGKQV